MKYQQTAIRTARPSLAIVATALAATTYSGVGHAQDAEPTQSPQTIPSVAASTAVSNSDSSYWSGEYWDAQQGSTFWHDLTPNRSTTSTGTEDDTANGSKNVRDLRRARAAAKAQR